MEDILEEVLNAISQKRKIVNDHKAHRFRLIGTEDRDYRFIIRELQTYVLENFGVRIPVVAGWYGCKTFEFEIEADELVQISYFRDLLEKNPELRSKIGKNFKIIAIDKSTLGPYVSEPVKDLPPTSNF